MKNHRLDPPIFISGVGRYLPQATARTEEIVRRERPGALFAEAVQAIIGCERVHTAAADETILDMCLPSARDALESSGTTCSDVELLASVSTMFPDLDMCSSAAKMALALGLEKAECFGFGDAGCAGTYAALRTLLPVMRGAEPLQVVLVTGGCIMPGHRFFGPATVFGDGAGALVLSRTPGIGRGFKVIRSDFYSVPALSSAFGPTAGMTALRKYGRLEPSWWTFSIQDVDQYETLRLRNGELAAEFIERSLDRAGWDPDELRYFVPDNVNLGLNLQLAGMLGIGPERVFADNCERTGHVFAADLFINLYDMASHPRVGPGDRLAFVGSGQGQHWGVLLVEVAA